MGTTPPTDACAVRFMNFGAETKFEKGASDRNSPTGRDRASRARGSFPLCTKCRSQTNERGIWPGNKTLYAHAYKIRKWRPSQRAATTKCCEWLLLTRGEFEAMKTLSGWEAVRCDEHPFRAKMKVST